MKIRFQADNDLHEDILRATKRLQPAIDFQLHLNWLVAQPVKMRLTADED